MNMCEKLLMWGETRLIQVRPIRPWYGYWQSQGMANSEFLSLQACLQKLPLLGSASFTV